MQFFKQLFLAGIVSVCLTALILGSAGQGVYPAAAFDEHELTIQKKAEKVQKTQAEIISELTVLLIHDDGWGSGVLKTTSDGRVWIWTCAHVVRAWRTETNEDGKRDVTFAPVTAVRKLMHDGKHVGDIKLLADVIRYSDADKKEDLALLRVRDTTFKPAHKLQFYLEKRPPPIGTRVLLAGNPREDAIPIVTDGIISKQGYVIERIPNYFDLVTCLAMGGVSGGPIVLESDGRYVGMIVRGNPLSITVPIRRMLPWAQRMGVAFTLDDSLPIPDDEELLSRNPDDSVE